MYRAEILPRALGGYEPLEYSAARQAGKVSEVPVSLRAYETYPAPGIERHLDGLQSAK